MNNYTSAFLRGLGPGVLTDEQKEMIEYRGDMLIGTNRCTAELELIGMVLRFALENSGIFNKNKQIDTE